MKKALVNYWVDLVTGVAFILCAVTGIVFLFPGAVHTAVGATPTILLIPALWWHKVHDWTGVAMVAGTAFHLALHAKWIANMTRKVFGEPAQTAPDRFGTPGRVALPAFAAPAAAPGDADAPVHLSPAEADAAAAASLERLETLRAERDYERRRRISRRRFLAGAATVGGAAVLAGVGLLGRDVASGASTRLRDDGWISSGQGQAGGGSSDSSTGGNGSSSAGGSAGSAQSSGSSGAATTATIVSVNQSACVACGRCLQVCPKGVFNWSSSGRADAANGNACVRCGRCLQVCPAGAITVNA